jgi:Ca-activated chloride channel family protein
MTFRFAQPLLGLIPVLVVGWWLLRQRGKLPSLAAINYSDIRLFAGLPVSWKVRFHWLPNALRWTAWACLVIALMRPQSGQSQQIIKGQGIEIVLALDISGSMAKNDFAPQNRLEAAKSVIDAFIQKRDFDRIGLVVFAHDAYQLIPPTLDYTALRTTLSNIQNATDEGITDGTAIGLGISSAANMLRSSEAASKVVILLTDGANNAGDIGPITAANALAALGIRVYTIGMVQRSAQPNADVDQVDEDTLRSVASITHGDYFPASDLEDLQTVYDQINALERSDVKRQVFIHWQEQFQIFAGSGLLLLVLERLLRYSLFQVIP